MPILKPGNRIWHDDRCGMYDIGKECVLVEYATGYARYMGKRQAQRFIKTQKEP